MRNQELHDALKEYCEAAISLIKTSVESKNDLPLTPEPEIEFSGSGYTVTSTMKINWLLLEVMYDRALKELLSYRRAVEALQADEIIAKHLNTLTGTRDALRRLEVDDCLRSLLITYMSEQEKSQKDIYSRVYENIEDYFYRDVLTFRFIVPLNNFKMEAERVELRPSFSIIKLTTEERASILSRVYRMDALGSLISYRGLEYSEYAFEIYYEEPKIIGSKPPFDPKKSAYNIVMQKVETACMAFRLYKSGNVSYEHVIKKGLFWNPLGESMSSPQPNTPFLFGNTYELTNDELAGFMEFWSRFEQAQIRENALKISLSRFSFAYERGRPEDRLIDYIIALEALLLENEPELRFKFSLRGAALLDDGNSQKRTKVFYELYEGYGQRNNIAHGNIPKQLITVGAETLQFPLLVERVASNVRSTIRAFILLGKSKKQILEMLNQKIISGFIYEEAQEPFVT